MTQEVFLEIIDEVNGFIEQFLVLTTVHENRLCTEHLRHLSKDRSTALSNEPIRELTYQWVGSNTAEPVRTTALQTYAQLADRNFLTLVCFSLVVELPEHIYTHFQFVAFHLLGYEQLDAILVIVTEHLHELVRLVVLTSE